MDNWTHKPTTMSDHQEVLAALAQMNRRLDSIDIKVNPMYEVFTKSRGFADTTVALMKTFLLVGAVVGGIYGLIKWLKA